MANTFVFEAPNSYGLTVDSSLSQLGTYIEGAPGVIVTCPDKYDQFLQFDSKEACLQNALTLDPSFSKNTIYGPIPLTIVDSSPEVVTGYVGQQVVLFCEVESQDPSVVLNYQWCDPQNVAIPTATSSVFTFTPSSKEYSGTYLCNVYASGSDNWTGSKGYSCQVILSVPLSF